MHPTLVLMNLQTALGRLSGYTRNSMDMDEGILHADNGKHNMVIEAISNESFVVQIYEKDGITGHEIYHEQHDLNTFRDYVVEQINHL